MIMKHYSCIIMQMITFCLASDVGDHFFVKNNVTLNLVLWFL